MKLCDASSIIGRWVQFRIETAGHPGDQVTLSITYSGTLDYWLSSGDRLFSQHFTYRIEGDEIVTHERDTSVEARSRFWFEGVHVLVLQKDGKRRWFRKDVEDDI